jgi:cytochrome b
LELPIDTGDAARVPAVRASTIWDLPVRLFHWSLALLILILFITGNVGGNWMEWHMYAGFCALALVLFRIIWGFIGSHHARFRNFVRGPAGVIGYIRTLRAGTAKVSPGHNPLGALSVLALLGAVLLQACTGLFSNDDIMLEGPLAASVSKRISDFLTHVHHLNSDLLLGLIALHVLAIAWYYFAKKENLVRPMLTGIKNIADDAAQLPRPVWLAWLVAGLVAFAVYWAVKK